MPFIFIINDFDFGTHKLKAEDVLEVLLDKGHWLFTKNTPNLKKINAGDEVIVYMAGKNRRYFCVSFNIGAAEFKI